MERFDDIYSDARWLEGKTARKNSRGRHTVELTPGPANVEEILDGKREANPSLTADKDLRLLLTSADEYLKSNESVEPGEIVDEDNEDMGMVEPDSTGTSEEYETDDTRDSFYHMEFRQHKRDYYTLKVDPKLLM